MIEILGRIKSAIEFLNEGLPFKVGELYLGIDNNKYFNVTGASKYVHFENLTRELATKELEEVKIFFWEMVNISVELKEFIRNREIKFNLDFDYGMGDIRVCSEKDGIIVWNSLL